MPDTVSDLARRLAENAEAVCRHYLSNGRRAGDYWRAGDVRNTPGRSLYVRLQGPSVGKGAAGKWTDAATGEHGDLLDLIRAARGLHAMGDVLHEAHRFLGLARSAAVPLPSSPARTPDAVQRLWARSKPIAGTLAETYLQARGIDTAGPGLTALRFHPHCFYRPEPDGTDKARTAWPALIAAVTHTDGEIAGLQRSWLDPAGGGKAPVATPRRALGHLLGNAVRFGTACDVMAASEGIETVLSLRRILPALPMAAALSAGHLAAFLPPPGLRRLYIIRDNDPAGHWAADRLVTRLLKAGIEAIVLVPRLGDCNDDLRQLGPKALAEPDLEDLLWSTVNLFHRAADRVERELDSNEQAQRRSQKEQDGSEVRSVELERLLAEGTTLIERRNAFEVMRDGAAEHFENHTGSAWRPRTGSMVNHRALTAAMIDSRDFLAAKRRADTAMLLPPGPKVAFAGGYECNDHAAIWAALDRVHAKHPGMVLLHGGSPKGAERIAACWADTRKVPQVAFKPDFTRHKNAAPFKRNDQLLETLPIGVVVFPGSGISENLADKARKLGIPLLDYRKGT